MPVEFNTNQDYILEDECVLLRPLVAEDCTNLLKFSLEEPELWKFSLIQAGGEENLKRYIQIAVDNRKAGREYPFIVYDIRSGCYAGSTRFYDIQVAYQCMQLGYTWYGKDFQGTGLNKHCKYLLLQFAFETLGMERVEFRADKNNSRSIAAMKSIGCVVEGVLRSQMPKYNTTERRDSIVLSILKGEWFDHVKEELGARLK
jgi:RimJ/RimL family protein N-acetyltransferase